MVGVVETGEIEMRTLLATLAALVVATPTLAQDSPTRALVNMIVAEQFCGIDAPQAYVGPMGDRAVLETGLTMEQLTYTAYAAANEIGKQYAANGTLGGFCREIGRIYGGLR